MGQCIYVAMTERGIVTREMASEAWMNPENAGRILGAGHLLNTTIGVWFYERDLWDKEELGKRLRALADHVTAPGYLKAYEDWGGEQLKLVSKEEWPLHSPMRTEVAPDIAFPPSPILRPRPGKRVPPKSVRGTRRPRGKDR